MTDYCDSSELYAFGLPRGSAPNPGRLIQSVNTGDNFLTLDEHGFAADDPLYFRAEAGGSLPSPLSAGTKYYARPVNDWDFEVAATVGGPAINLTTSGSRILVIAPLPVAETITAISRLIDEMLPAHLVPITEPIPEIVRMTAAELTAEKLLIRQGASAKSFTLMADAAHKRLERWAKHVPVRGAGGQESAGSAVAASVPYLDPRGWSRFGGL